MMWEDELMHILFKFLVMSIINTSPSPPLMQTNWELYYFMFHAKPYVNIKWLQ